MHLSTSLKTRGFAAGLAAVALAAVPAASADASAPAAVAYKAAGKTPASIQYAVNSYRNALGAPNNGSALGSQPSGRREINWDGTPDAKSAPNKLPLDFFNTNVPRGAVFSTPGVGVQVSGNAGVAPIEFDNLDPLASKRFRTFSPQRLFTPLKSTVTNVHFRVPGSTTRATVSGFGAVFTDVDRWGSTKITYYDKWNAPLGTYTVPAYAGNETLSFLGVKFHSARVARVQIKSGDIPIGSTGPSWSDTVAMDDFIYGEPKM
jgi:hypothetical protein